MCEQINCLFNLLLLIKKGMVSECESQAEKNIHIELFRAGIEFGEKFLLEHNRD